MMSLLDALSEITRLRGDKLELQARISLLETQLLLFRTQTHGQLVKTGDTIVELMPPRKGPDREIS